MTIVHMSGKGEIVLPKKIREQHGFRNGSAFAVLKTKSGMMVLKPVKEKTKLSLIEHLRKFKGVEIPQFKAHCPPRV